MTIESNRNKWNTFEHKGVLFPPEYKKLNIPLIYENKEVILPELAEEYALLYSKYIDSEYIKYKQFNKNFWKDWKKTLLGTDIIELDKCNFSNFVNYLNKEKLLRLNYAKGSNKEEKEQIKNDRNKQEEPYKTAIVDGKTQSVGNFKMEPPGIFIGRGNHPKLGCIKKRIYPEDIILNIGKESKVPIPTILYHNKTTKIILYEGHKWQEVIHDHKVEWLASWKDNISGKVKYVWLGNNSNFKMNSDLNKFELARKLKNIINKVKEVNNNNLTSNDLLTRQLATALYFIDSLALRVGNEKFEDESDTVGVTSLRVEHVKLLEDFKITLDFLGKDSVRYKNTVTIPKQIYDFSETSPK